MDLFWRENKRFLLGVGAALLVGLLFHMILVGPARQGAATARTSLRGVQERLAKLLETRGQPTDEMLGRAREDLERLEKNVRSVSTDITLAMPKSFVVPKGEKSPGFYFDTEFNQAKGDMRRLAPKAGPEGVRLPADGKFGFMLAPAPGTAQEFLVRLALVQRLVRDTFNVAAAAKVAEVTELQAVPGAAQGAPVGPSPDTFIQRHNVEMKLRCDFQAFLSLLHGLSQKGNFLAVERLSFVKEDQLVPLGTAELGVSGLGFKLDGTLEGSSPGADAGGGAGGGARTLFRRGRG